jgi:hypothetical protein
MRCRVFFTFAPLVSDNLRPGGALRGKWRPSVRKVGEWFVESQHLQGCSPSLCWLTTDGLALVSKY